MEFTTTSVPGVTVVDPVVYEDGRGFLMETWRASRFSEAGIDAEFVQDVYSRSSSGTVRGLHYQLRHAQGKLVRVVHGELFDVAVDLRRSSPTFGQWVAETLSEGNRKLIWIPPGFAHGFMVMSDYADIEYRMTDYYSPDDERSIRWDDPDIAIDWPQNPAAEPALSARDLAGQWLKDADVYD